MVHPGHPIPRPHIRPAVLEARERLAQGREKLRRQHEAGSPGIQVCNRLATLVDEIVVDLFAAMLADMDGDVAARLRPHVALVPFGGYGRCDVAPFSDVDLMLLYHARVAADVPALAKRIVTDLGDAGLALGFNARRPEDACRLALSDATILTGLSESRFLAGSQELYDRFAARFKRQVMRRWRRLTPMIEEARREERAKFGETVYLLEPNIKRSRGGLRDIQLIRWIGFVRFGESHPDALERAGRLSKRDAKVLRDATEFLLRTRNEMHFSADKARDLLDRREQVRLAEVNQYPGSEAVLPVERFMQEYFLHTTEVRNIAADICRRARPRSVAEVLDPLIGINMEGDFRIGPSGISATRRGMPKVQNDLAQVLRLMDLANMTGKRIGNRTWEAIRQSMMAREDVFLTDDAMKRFLSLLSRPGQLGDLLRRLHELRVLEKVIPDFKHARNLLQFNEYHKLTVDAHCIRAVEVCSEFQNHPGRLGQVYRSINQKRTLHLALLLHDLGKGFPEDHSDVGRRIAVAMAQRLKLPLREARRVEFLVHKHLVMSHLAFRRDTSDEEVIVKFAVEVGSPDRLKMLYVL
ncbi:MAG: HD domain-containing protein, partial [Planctomycetales bacterium]|nr:HD domain-containing protein [Planctomycetales bacterium]